MNDKIRPRPIVPVYRRRKNQTARRISQAVCFAATAFALIYLSSGARAAGPLWLAVGVALIYGSDLLPSPWRESRWRLTIKLIGAILTAIAAEQLVRGWRAR